MEICKQQSETEMRHLPLISIYGYVGGRQIMGIRMGIRMGVANFFLDQSIGIDETNTFQLQFFI